MISVRSHPSLSRDGTLIHSDVEVSYIDAILGTTLEVRWWMGNLKKAATATYEVMAILLPFLVLCFWAPGLTLGGISRF